MKQSVFKNYYQSANKAFAALLIMFGILFACATLLMPTNTYAAIDVYEFDTPQQEEQYRELIDELRCPKCQNQNLAGSDSQIAQDLKRKVYQMVQDGKSDEQIYAYMTERYGDFISYKPPIRPTTWILWFFPPFLLLCLIGWWFWRTLAARKRNKALSAVNKSMSSTQTTTGSDNPIEASRSHNLATNTQKLTDNEQQQLDALLKKHDSPNDDS